MYKIYVHVTLDSVYLIFKGAMLFLGQNGLKKNKQKN